MEGLNLEGNSSPVIEELPLPKMSLSREKVLEEARKVVVGGSDGKKGLSLVIVGEWSLRFSCWVSFWGLMIYPRPCGCGQVDDDGPADVRPWADGGEEAEGE